ncbi:luciferin 4-monooxygenase-like [Oppia nitens]|uniref:luciferin 4-monooxygenase-like n=1 Tax=Oppia nitens TaxID=1686743 RepID=UPI0023DC9435|nr:luciferin 4-monooxygenase-like [Oppia nitens]
MDSKHIIRSVNYNDVDYYYKYQSIIELLIGKLQSEPMKLYMTDSHSGRQWTRGQVLESALSFGQYLRTDDCCRLETGETVCFITHSNDLHAIGVLGVLAAGGVYSSLYSTSTENEIDNMIQTIKPIILVGCQQNMKLLNTIQQKYKFIKSILDLDIISKLDINNKLPVPITTTPTPQPTTNLATLLMSSGTTGWQKAISWTNSQWLSLMAIMQHRDVLPLNPDDILLSISFSHGMGLVCLFQTIVTDNGCQLVVLNDNDYQSPQSVFRLIHDYRVTVYYTLPNQMKFLAKHFNQYDKQYLKSLDNLIVIGGDLNQQIYDKIIDVYGFKQFRRCYGMSEIGTAFIEPASKLNSLTINSTDTALGKVVPGMEIKIIDTNNCGNSLPANQTGQICLRGPTVTPGYFGNPGATNQLFTSDGFLLTGDLGYYDQNQYFYFVGRLKDFIIFNGIKFSPNELELHLLGHPLVDRAAVLGVDDKQYGQIPRAYVTLIAATDTDNTVTTDKLAMEMDLQQYVNRKVNNIKQLRGGVKILDKMPMTSLGKINKMKLKMIN